MKQVMLLSKETSSFKIFKVAFPLPFAKPYSQTKYFTISFIHLKNPPLTIRFFYKWCLSTSHMESQCCHKSTLPRQSSRFNNQQCNYS